MYILWFILSVFIYLFIYFLFLLKPFCVSDKYIFFSLDTVKKNSNIKIDSTLVIPS